MKEEPIVLKAGFVQARRWLGVISLGLPAVLVGIVILQGAITSPQSLIIVLLIAAAFGWSAYRMWNVPIAGIEFDGSELRTQDGVVIAKLQDIVSVQTGIFALRPSNGFMMVMKDSERVPTRPGIYWRQGRHIGVGGLLQAAEAKAIGRALQFAVAKRDNT